MITLLAEKEYLTPPDNEAVLVTKSFFAAKPILFGQLALACAGQFVLS